MKTIVNRKTYNTDTATAISEWNNGLYGSFGYTEEILYKKRTGEYFLYGSSGPQGKYAKMISENNWSGGERIIPYTKEEAIKWLEKYDVEAYIKEFGEPEE